MYARPVYDLMWTEHSVVYIVPCLRFVCLTIRAFSGHFGD